MKQSIYKFRDANPWLIKQKSDEYALYTPDAFMDSSKIMLNMNFRSRPEVLSCVNSIFRQLMSEKSGELDYIEDQFLYAGSTSYNETIDDNLCTDVVLISSDKNADAYTDETSDEDLPF